MEENSKKLNLNLDGRKFRTGNACSFIESKGYFCQYMWMTSKMAGQKQQVAPMWKKLMTTVDKDVPTSFLYHVYLGCSTQRKCKPNETFIEQKTKMFESRTSLLEQQKKLPVWKKRHAQTVAQSYGMEGHAQKCVERYCEAEGS